MITRCNLIKLDLVLVLPIDILLDLLSKKFDVVALPLTSIRSRGMLNLASLEISRTQNIFCNL